MVKYTDINLIYTSPCFPPDGIKLNKIYTIIKNNDNLFVKTGDEEIQLEETLIKMLFEPKGVKWEEVNFKDEEVKSIKTFDKTIK